MTTTALEAIPIAHPAACRALGRGVGGLAKAVLLIGIVLLAGCGGNGDSTEEAESESVGEQASRSDAAAAEGGSDAPPPVVPAGLPRVRITTTHGPLVVELYRDGAPRTVDWFLGLVEAGFYDGTVFHQVSPGFLIMGGRFDLDYGEKQPPTGGSRLINEAKTGLKNTAGTIAMSREPGFPNSAKTEFFFNLADNARLDFRPSVPGSPGSPSPAEPGYCAFGRVVEGMETLGRISAVPVEDTADFVQKPVSPVVINSMTRLQ